MALFNNMLDSEQSIFKDPVALDYDYMPQIINGRQQEQQKIAFCIKPLDQKRNGSNLIISGKPGVGKTATCKHMLKIVEEEADDIVPIYINCWKKNTSYKVMVEICQQLGYKLTHNKKTEELFEIAQRIINKKSAVFVFDEIDKADELDFLYMILEEIYRKSIIIITNDADWQKKMDPRIRSRLMAGTMEFEEYKQKETQDILEYRKGYAFVENVWNLKTFQKIIQKTVDLGDIRLGLYLMKESGNNAENRSSKIIEIKDIEQAMKKLNDFNIKEESQLDQESKFVLDIIKKTKLKKTGELFEEYQSQGGKKTYRTFQRCIKELSQNKFISTKKIKGGKQGNTTIIDYSTTKKITDF